MTNPGDAVPYGDDALIRRIQDLERFVRESNAARSLEASQIGSGGIRVTDGGSITVEAPGTIDLTGGNFSAANVTASNNVTAAGAVQGATVVSTGPVNAVDVNASGRATSAAAFRSMGSYGYHVVSGYQAMWINSDGTIGVSASNRDSKKDLEPLSNIDPLLALKPMLGRYVWDNDDAPLKQFLIAEDVYEAGFGPDVVPLGEDGTPLSINYSQLVPALIATVQKLSAQVSALMNPTA